MSADLKIARKGALFHYPKESEFGGTIPKERIYSTAKLSADLKRDFTQQIAKIRWSHKLSEESLNLPASEHFKEFEVISITLKGEALNLKCLEALDRTIPFPLIFEILRPADLGNGDKAEIGTIQTVAAYKIIEKGSVKLASRYYQSPRYSVDEERSPLPQSDSLEALYKALIQILLQSDVESNPNINSAIGRQKGDISLNCSAPSSKKAIEAPLKGEEGVPALEEEIAREEALQQLTEAINRLQNRVNREPQFNRKVEHHAELKKLQAKLKALAET